MTHQMQTTALDRITELLAEHGFDGLASAVTVLLNEVMKIERAHALRAGPYQRSEQRAGHADGFKPRTIRTRASFTPRTTSAERSVDPSSTTITSSSNAMPCPACASCRSSR